MVRFLLIIISLTSIHEFTQRLTFLCNPSPLACMYTFKYLIFSSNWPQISQSTIYNADVCGVWRLEIYQSASSCITSGWSCAPSTSEHGWWMNLGPYCVHLRALCSHVNKHQKCVMNACIAPSFNVFLSNFVGNVSSRVNVWALALPFLLAFQAPESPV